MTPAADPGRPGEHQVADRRATVLSSPSASPDERLGQVDGAVGRAVVFRTTDERDHERSRGLGRERGGVGDAARRIQLLGGAGPRRRQLIRPGQIEERVGVGAPDLQLHRHARGAGASAVTSMTGYTPVVRMSVDSTPPAAGRQRRRKEQRNKAKLECSHADLASNVRASPAVNAAAGCAGDSRDIAGTSASRSARSPRASCQLRRQVLKFGQHTAVDWTAAPYPARCWARFIYLVLPALVGCADAPSPHRGTRPPRRWSASRQTGRQFVRRFMNTVTLMPPVTTTSSLPSPSTSAIAIAPDPAGSGSP